MKKTISILFMSLIALGVIPGLAHAQTGTLQGYVYSSEPPYVIIDAPVRLDHLGLHFHCGPHFSTVTVDSGEFYFTDVPIGVYSVNAMWMNHGFAADVIEITAGTTTYIRLWLSGSWEYPLPGIALSGIAAVRENESTGAVEYFLDVGCDSHLDYRLSLGPPWYTPPVGNAYRPYDYDSLTVEGGLFAYSDPPMIIAYTLNREFWRDTSAAHGGFGGGIHQMLNCSLETISRVEAIGTATKIQHEDTLYGLFDYYLFENPTDSIPRYILDFGDESYDPGRGVEF